MVIHPEIELARRLLLDHINFDVFTDPIFIEAFICKLCGFIQTKKQETYDAVSPEGFKLEIKHSALMTKSSAHQKYFAFGSLRGITKKGKNADVFILIGYGEEQLRFFVIPAYVVSKRDTLEIHVQARLYQKSGKWLNFEVPLSQLIEAVKNRGEENLNPSPLFTSLT